MSWSFVQEDLVVYQKEQVRLRRVQSTSITLAADDMLNLLLHLMSSRHIPHLKSSLMYMTKFCWTIPDASLQYALTTFEAAVRFLESPAEDDDATAAKSRNSSVSDDRGRTSSQEYHSGSSFSEWDILPVTNNYTTFPLRPQSASPSKSSSVSQIDGKLRNLSLLMDEPVQSSSSVRSSTPSSLESPKKVMSPLAGMSGRVRDGGNRSSSPLDSLSGGMSFGQQNWPCFGFLCAPFSKWLPKSTF